MEYSIIVPVFNSQDTLEELFRRILKALSQRTFEVIFVDDNSRDNSWKILNKIKLDYPEIVKIIRLAKNYGQHNASFCGLKHSRGQYIITIDDDLQYAPEDILKLIEAAQNQKADLIYGIGDTKHSLYRRTGSKLYKIGAKRLEKGLGEGSSFRILSRNLVDKVIIHDQHFIFLDELLFWYTNYIFYIKVDHFKRMAGSSGYTPSKIFKLLKNNTLTYGSWPLKIMVYGGSLLSLITFLIGVFYIIKKLVFGISVPGFTALMVTILFSTSIILMCFGVLGKYLINIHVLLNKKPAYSIKEML